MRQSRHRPISSPGGPSTSGPAVAAATTASASPTATSVAQPADESAPSAFTATPGPVVGLPGDSSSSLYVERTGSQLTLGGAPWRFVGFNDYQLTSMPGGFVCGRAIDDATLDSMLADARADGATVIRTWFFQSYFQTSGWTAFDRVLNAAAQYGLKVIPVLVNEWTDCEPSTAPKDLAFFQSGYEQPNSYGYPLSFRDYATTVATHYADDPTVAFWEIGNEMENYSSAGCDSSAETAGASALRAFADDMTGAIKQADPNHLVALGTQGTGQCGLAGSDFQYVHAGAIDLCDYHDYNDATHSIPNDGYNRLAQRITQCAALNKPLFVGESGIVADVGDQGQSTGTIDTASLQRRAGFFNAKMTAAFASGIAGYLIWDKEQDASDSTYNLNNGRYEVGPSALTFDPTNTVVAEQAAALSATPSPAVETHGFDDGGLAGWLPLQSPELVSLSNSTAEAWAGIHALAITLSGQPGNPQIATGRIGDASPGSIVTYHLYLPADAPPALRVQPFFGRGALSLSAPVALQYGWNVVTVQLPTTLPSTSLLGLQIDNPTGSAATLFLDNFSS